MDEMKALVAQRRIRVGPREHGEDVGAVGERAPSLLAAEHIGVAFERGATRERGGVASVLRFGECRR